jgi:hypothetical protein
MTKDQEVYSGLTLQTTNVLLSLTRLEIRRAQIAKKTPERKDLLQEFDEMIENLESVRRAEENKTLRLKVQHRIIWNRDKEIRELKRELTKAKEMNEHLLDGI